MFLAKVVANHGFVQAFSVEQELRDVLLAAADALVVNEELDALDGEEVGLGVYCRGFIVGFIVGGIGVWRNGGKSKRSKKIQLLRFFISLIKKLYIFEFNLQYSNKQYVHTISKEYHNKYAT